MRSGLEASCHVKFCLPPPLQVGSQLPASRHPGVIGLAQSVPFCSPGPIPSPPCQGPGHEEGRHTPHSVSGYGMTAAILALGWQCHVHSVGNPAGVSLSSTPIQVPPDPRCGGCNIWGHLSIMGWG